MATNLETTRNWLRQSGKAQNGNNTFYRDATIYSYGYHFPIARIVHAPVTHERIILMTTRGYGNATAKHKSIVWGLLCRSNFRVFHVDDVLADDHAANLVAIEAKAAEYEAKAKRARTYKEDYLSQAHSLRQDAMSIASTFGA